MCFLGGCSSEVSETAALSSQRLQKKYDTAPDKFPTLQSIVDSEIAEGTNTGSKSCTVGLLWLKRLGSVLFPNVLPLASPGNETSWGPLDSS